MGVFVKWSEKKIFIDFAKSVFANPIALHNRLGVAIVQIGMCDRLPLTL